MALRCVEGSPPLEGCRWTYYSGQIESFEATLEMSPSSGALIRPNTDFTGVFIRAPVSFAFIQSDHHFTRLLTDYFLPSMSYQIVLELNSDPERPPIQPLARIPTHIHPHNVDNTTADDPRRVVALRQGHLMLTTFHPELTQDHRFHEYFIEEIVTPFYEQ